MIKAAAATLLILASLAHSPARTTEGEATALVYLCDPTDGMHARIGRSGILKSAGAGKDTILVVTGGALSSSSAVPAGFDVVNLAHRDLVDGERLSRALSSSSALFVSAIFRLTAPTPTPWKSHVIVERGGLRTGMRTAGLRGSTTCGRTRICSLRPRSTCQ